MSLDAIRTASDVRTWMLRGYELWIEPWSPRPHLPGAWSLRKGRTRFDVHWEAIDRIRAHPAWFERNLEAGEQIGQALRYRLRQRQIDFASMPAMPGAST